MLVYATKFTVTDDLDIVKFIDLATEWVLNPSSNYEFADFSWDGKEEFTVLSKDGKTTFSVFVLIEHDTVAVRLRTTDQNSIEWENLYSLVGNELYVQLQKHNTNSEVYLTDNFHLPYLIKLLYKYNFVHFDNTTELNTGWPMNISSSLNLEIAKNLMTKKYYADKPIVYVSIYHNQGAFSHAVNTEMLTKQLLGLAYVFAEIDVEASNKLSSLTSYSNPYNGAIQIYYPNGYCRRFLPDAFSSEYKLRNEIAKAIFDRSLHTKVDEKFTFFFITNEIYKIRIRNLERNKDNIEQLKDELALANQRIDELSTERDQLKNDTYSYQTRIDSLVASLEVKSDTALLSRGELKDLYENEVFDCVYDVLSETLKATSSRSRCHEILTSLLNTNKSSYKNTRYSKMDKFKEIIYAHPKVNKHMKNQLRALGLVIEGSNHPKIRFPHGKLMVTLSSTPSDDCDADNAIRDFNKLF